MNLKLSGRRAPSCTEHQFRAKNNGEHLNRFRDIIVERLKAEGRQKERIRKILPHTFAFGCLPLGF